MKLETKPAHENCELCESHRDFSLEQFAYEPKVECSFRGYGGTTPEGVNHYFMVRWVADENESADVVINPSKR